MNQPRRHARCRPVLLQVAAYSTLVADSVAHAQNTAAQSLQPAATLLAAAIAFVGVVLGALLALGGVVYTARKNRQQKLNELLISTFDYFTGRSQRRSVGIAALEFFWREKEHKPACIGLAAGSAVYLLAESEQGDSKHELFNLKRLMRLLADHTPNDQASKIAYREVIGCISARLDPSYSGKGLKVDRATLEDWKKNLEYKLR